MALCDRCFGRMYDPANPTQPCRSCGGTCFTSCCDGPVGEVLGEQPTDPKERGHNA